MAVAERQRPQGRQRERCAVLVGERAEEGAALQVVSVDVAIARIANQQGAAEETEIRRRQGEPPRRIERALGSKAPYQIAGGVVDVDEAVPRAGDFIRPALVLHRVGDEEQVIDVLDVEGGKPGREVRVLEGTGTRDWLEVLVEHVDPALAEIGGVKEALAGGVGGEGESFVDRPGGRVINGQQSVERIDDSAPAGDGAVFGGEQEAAGCGNAVFRHGEAGSAIKDRAGGRAARARGRRHRYDQRQRLSAPIQEVGDAAAVVGEPERACWAEGDAPGIDQIRVRDAGQSRHVRDQVDLGITSREETAIFQALNNRPIGALQARCGLMPPEEKSPRPGRGTHGITSAQQRNSAIGVERTPPAAV